MKNQALFSLKDKSKKLKCRLLLFLFGALMVNQLLKKCGKLQTLIAQIRLLLTLKSRNSRKQNLSAKISKNVASKLQCSSRRANSCSRTALSGARMFAKSTIFIFGTFRVICSGSV